MLIPLVATDIVLVSLLCTALGVLLVRLPQFPDTPARAAGDLETDEIDTPAKQSQDPKSNEPEPWLLRLKAAYQAGYYQTEADCEYQTPIPWSAREKTERHVLSAISRRVVVAWRASHALTASPFSATTYRRGSTAPVEEARCPPRAASVPWSSRFWGRWRRESPMNMGYVQMRAGSIRLHQNDIAA